MNHLAKILLNTFKCRRTPCLGSGRFLQMWYISAVSKGTEVPWNHPSAARKRSLWGSVFPGLSAGNTAGHRAPSLLWMLNICLMTIRRNTEAESAEMTSRCMRSPCDASPRKMPGFQCMFMEAGLENSMREGKSTHTTIPLAAKIPCLKQTCKCVFFLQITCVRDTLISPSVFH